MASVSFASAIQRHHPCPEMTVGGTTVRAALQEVFAAHLLLRSYVLDGQQIEDPTLLSDAVRAESKIHVLQALSGG